MKKQATYLLFTAAALLLAASCQEEKLDPKSVIADSTVEMNPFDLWLETNFLKPYNIEFKYRYALNESDKGYYTVPASYEASIIYAHLVKYLCIDTYDEIAGVDFTRGYFPKMFFLIGTWEFKNNGSIVLGTAEGGKKIMLSGVNYLPIYLSSYEGDELVDILNTYYIKTIHHEFTHILNQTKEFSDSFKQITASTYVSDACFDTDEYWRGRGYITAYAQSEPREDFAELLSEYITHNADWWTSQLEAAESETAEVRKEDPNATSGATLINSKIDIVRTYMQDSWGIDIDELRDIVNRRFYDVVDGLVDLNSVAL
ncbi:MAG: putative zinc-binding metallopeptidase [Bacteroidales bacterium]|nr:putative zinc-binding metallopeptidase [Bacteroidales bacterium]